MKFSHFSVEHGLSQSSALSILQDKRGFLWIGTQDGLNRFDGYTFLHFWNTAQPTDFADNYIQAIMEDKKGMIWLGTQTGGLSMFDYRTEQFTNFGNGSDKQNNGKQVVGLDVRAIAEDTYGNIWFATNDGLGKFDRAQHTFTAYKRLIPSQNGDDIRALVADTDGSLWVGTLDGLVRFTPSNGHIERIALGERNYKVYALLLSKILPQHLWIGTDNGVLVLHTVERSARKVLRNGEEVLGTSHVRTLCEDRTGTLWIGSFGKGVVQYNVISQQYAVHVREDIRPSSLSNDFICTIHEDRSGIIWIGSYGGGVNKYDPALSKFTTYSYNPHQPASLSNMFVYSFLEDRSGTLWVGTSNGLNRLVRRERGEFARYYPAKNDPTNFINLIRAIYEDAKGQLWLGTGNGLLKFNPTSGQFKVYNPSTLHSSVPDTNSFAHAIIADNQGMLWLGTQGSGIYCFNPETEQFIAHYTHEPDNPNSLAHNAVLTLYRDTKGRIWIGTNGGGISLFNPLGREFTTYRHNPQVNGTLSNNVVCSIFQDSKGRMWFGTTGGLNRFDEEKQVFVSIRRADGLPNDVVYGILEDNAGNLWLSTNKGISRYTPADAVPHSPRVVGKFHNFDVNDGLQSNEFNAGAYYRGASGRMYFGGIRGFNEFFPDSIRPNTYIPPVVITGFRKRGISVEMSQAISVVKEIEVSAQDNIISLEFAALSFSLPEKNTYAYKLEGFDESWHYHGARREATYTNLSGGTYVFRVKAANSDGVWNEEGASLRIIILPHWYMRWWAIVLWVSLVGTGAFGIYKWRVKTIEETNRLLQKTVDERTREVQRQIKILNELAQEIELANTELQDRNSQVEKQNAQFAEMNQQLNEKNRLLDQALADLHSLNQELETRIQERTLELKQAKEALEKALAQEKEINTLRARLIASISHEFRTPITVIQSSCGILQRYIDKMTVEQRQKQFAHIEESSKRLVNILDAVITMSTIENRPLRLMPTDVVKRTEELVRDFGMQQQRDYGDNAHEIVFIPHTDISIVNIDEEAIRQILLNLLSNAVKFSPPRSRVVVEFTQKTETLLWSVQDSGMGIDDEDMPYIFELFYRAGKTESSTIQGVGLGLSIVNKLVELMRGEVWFETEVGKGTTFFVEIPIIQGDKTTQVQHGADKPTQEALSM
ncbi:MAG: ATP-binding protein [Candidatus Kapabacteria bacterium]|nr:ATP-binding protein [Candidatus Kapabacteria bacterium]